MHFKKIFEPYFSSIEEDATTHTGSSKLGASDEKCWEISRKDSSKMYCPHTLRQKCSYPRRSYNPKYL